MHLGQRVEKTPSRVRVRFSMYKRISMNLVVYFSSSGRRLVETSLPFQIFVKPFSNQHHSLYFKESLPILFLKITSLVQSR